MLQVKDCDSLTKGGNYQEKKGTVSYSWGGVTDNLIGGLEVDRQRSKVG